MAVVAAAFSACTAATDATEPTSGSQEELSATPNGSGRVPLPFTPFTLPANRCGFPIHIEAVADNEFQDVTTLADGTTITNIRGLLMLSFTNTNNGVTIVRNVSGPTTETDHPDGTGTFIGRGNNWFGFGPVSQGNTGEPGLVFTSGRVELQIAGGFITSFALSGTQTNGCDLLR
jgi:hypothetical protein